MRSGNSKQCNQKNLVHRKMADRAITDHGDLTVKIRNRWTEKLLTKMCLPPTARVSAESRDENE